MSNVSYRDTFDQLSLNKLYTLARELGQIRHGMSVLDNLSLNKLYTLASAPEEVKEEY